MTRNRYTTMAYVAFALAAQMLTLWVGTTWLSNR